VKKETSINVRALRRLCREDILTRERRGWRVRKKIGWLERAQLFVLRCSHSQDQTSGLDSLITSRKARGVMHIGRANDKLKSGNAACPACLPCMESFGAKQVG
jgi:hypothetical protein